jgi:uncharacterized protein
MGNLRSGIWKPMEPSLILVPLVALAASLLTFISGFGLGTLLLPVFAVFFPVEVAILLTAVVHLLNNVFKFALVWRSVDRPMLMRFGVPGIAGAFVGAAVVHKMGAWPPLFAGSIQPVGPLKLIIGILMLGIWELRGASKEQRVPAQWLMPGGFISGFFGGLSGHQGALRSLFLLHTGLEKQAFIATGIAIALLVDLTRLPMYLANGMWDALKAQQGLLLTTTLAAFAGAYWGKQVIPKVTLRTAQLAAGALMVFIALMLMVGVL